MPDTKDESLCDWPKRCYEVRVSGSKYCEDHLMEAQLKSRIAAPTGTLAALIRKAQGHGLLKPVSSYTGN